MTSVIVVDDDSDVVDVSVEYLELHGLEVRGVGHDGRDAVVLYKTLKPDVVLLDMNMPEYDGKYAINGIKEINPNAKIIVCSAYVDDYKLNKNEVFYILRKPYESDELLKAITEAVR